MMAIFVMMMFNNIGVMMMMIIKITLTYNIYMTKQKHYH